MTAEPTRWIAYGARSAHDLATNPPCLPERRGRRVRFVGRCACGWQTRRATRDIAWESLLCHIADGRLAEVLEPTTEQEEQS